MSHEKYLKGFKNKVFLTALDVAGLKNGSPGRARTADPVINSHLLYRLSYRGI